jgi:hypothetical protein
VIDLTAGKKLTVIDAPNFKAAFLSNVADEDFPGQVNPLFRFVEGSIQTLWGLRDGKQKNLGSKEVEGQMAEGFEVDGSTPQYAQKIRIWAAKKTAQPVLVEVEIRPPGSSDAVMLTFKDFALDAQLDESLFSLPAPQGFPVSGSLKLEELAATAPAAGEAAKLVRVLELCRQGQQPEAVKILLSVDWTASMQFGATPAVFGMTEKQVVSLSEKERQAVIAQVLEDLRLLRVLAREVISQGDDAAQRGQVDEADRLYKVVLNLGHTLDRNPDNTLIAVQAGKVIRYLALKQMVALYQQAGRATDQAAAEQEMKGLRK